MTTIECPKRYCVFRVGKYCGREHIRLSKYGLNLRCTDFKFDKTRTQERLIEILYGIGDTNDRNMEQNIR